jgi:3-oxoacyl-[acyl-carrier protein] reductase
LVDLELTGRRAFVAASTSGLGLACAKALAMEGARVTITGRRGELARSMAAELPGGAVGIGVDLSDADDAKRAMQVATTVLGGIDVLVLNSGGPPPIDVLDASVADLEGSCRQILYSAHRLIRAFVPGMRERRWGRVIAVGSSGVEQPISGLATSNAARAALAAWLKTLANEVAADGVTVNMVLPGRVDTERVRSLDRKRAKREGVSAEEVVQASQASIPIGRYGSPEEFGSTVTYLASGPASFITGSLVRVDGGLIRTIT